MNILRLFGDVCHVWAIISLFLKIWRSKSCAGISGKSQVLFALVFTTRFMDLFTFISIYINLLKVVYLVLAYATVSLIYFRFRDSYDSESDSFRLEFLLVLVAGLSFLVNQDFSLLEILWTFSIYLESLAILPQMFMIRKTGRAETFITNYMLFLGLYRALYLGNWVWRFYYEGFYDLIAIVSGIIQTVIYCCFYLYFTRVLRGSGKGILPLSVTELSDPAPSLDHTHP